MFSRENERILCIGLAMLVSAIALPVYFAITNCNSNAVAGITRIRSRLVSQFASSIGMGGMTQGNLMAVVPSDWKIATNGSGLLREGPLKGVKLTLAGEPASNKAKLTFSGLSQKQCMKLIPKLGNNWVSTKVGENNATFPDGSAKSADLMAKCSVSPIPDVVLEMNAS
jgi:hypothetical protein